VEGIAMIKRLIIAASACALTSIGAAAADMPVKAPEAPVPHFDWSGLYLGGEAGFVRGHVHSLFLNGNPPFPAGTVHDTTSESWLAGFQGGFNYQFAPNWLVGVEGDFTWTGLSGDHTYVSTTVANRQSINHGETPWQATLTGRLGYVVNDWLFYVKGGAAWRHHTYNSTSINSATAAVLATSSGSDTTTGWTVGTGLEWKVWQNWSAKVEYDYMRFDYTQSALVTYFGAAGVNPRLNDTNVDVHRILFGINYFFHWGG
jgi:outer membrane immunogenic protein